MIRNSPERAAKRYYDLASSVVQRRFDPLLRRRIDIADIVQEILLDLLIFRAHECKGEFSAALVVQISKQKVVDFFRKHVVAEKRSVLRERYDGALASVHYQNRSALNEGMAELEELIEHLPPRDVEIISVRVFDDHSNLEAAKALGISPNAASNRYVRAVERLRQLAHEAAK